MTSDASKMSQQSELLPNVSQGDAQPSDGPPSSTSSVPSLNVEPLHHPEEMAHVEIPHNVENVPHGATLMNGKALLAKKMAASGQSFYSPSDSLVSPCTQKLSSQKGKRWANAKVKPVVFGKYNLNTSSNALSLEDRVDSKDDSLKGSADNTAA